MINYKQEMMMFPLKERWLHAVDHEVPQSSLWLLIQIFLLDSVRDEHLCVMKTPVFLRLHVGDREHAHKHIIHLVITH